MEFDNVDSELKIAKQDQDGGGKRQKEKIKMNKEDETQTERTQITDCITVDTWSDHFQWFFVFPTKFTNTCLKTSQWGQNQR